MQISLAEAQNQLSYLIQAAIAGDEIIIANQECFAVRLVPVTLASKPRQPGAWSELLPPANDWDSQEFNQEIAQSLLGELN